ncbi:DUF5776 domain-containing protein [Lentilactobacillus diolivorans]|uniref:DUF5776 domain-containing protein n=1 Tax=Lentilactobacillus diolivorans TaxID=179838 RepID=A0ABQ0XHD8_9LACO|nr:DUF5776 domain-containing protein [Lentilactobacillus diolivorans]GEP23649.1 hypothetical protein LDI01_12420 [Lentilactobacillus diolivorans]
MSTDTHRGLKHLFKIALLSATFFTFGATAVATTASADDTSGVPAVYNGKNPQRDMVTNVSSDGQTQPQQYFTSWFSLAGQDSNYTGPTTGSNPNSILNLDDYTKDPSSLYEHLLIKNDSNKPMKFSIDLCLPQFWRGKPTVNTNWPVYGSDKIATPTAGSTTQGLDVKYSSFTKYYIPQENVTAADLQDLGKISVGGTLQSQEHYQLDVPLKLIDPENIELDDLLNGAKFNSVTINNQSNGYYVDHVRFARGVNAYKQLGINGTNKYVVTYRTNDKPAKYYHAADIQNLMPVIKPDDTVVNDFGGYDPKNNDFPYIYTGGGNFFLNYQTIKDINGNNLVQTFQNNGYAAPYNDKLGTIFPYYAWSYMNKINDSGSTSEGDWGNMDGISNYGMQIVKVIDVNGINDQDQLFLNPGAKWNPMDNVKIWNPQQTYQELLPNAKPTVTSTRPLNADGTLNTNQTGSFDITYNYPFTYTNGNKVTFKKTIHVIVGNNSGGGTTTTPSDTTGSSSSSTTTGSSSSTSSSSSSTPTTTTKPSTSVGPNIAVKGEAVYATKKIGLYKSTNFTKSKRIAWYPKQKRVNRPMFVVTGYKRAANGALRYKVRDVNHGRKTAGKKGYITASRKYVVPVYYASVPKSKKITVISRKGINTYKSANLTGKAKHYKKGVRLTVKKLVKHNLTTRYQLSNGHFVTANKKLVIAGNY